MQIAVDASRAEHPAPTGVEVYSDRILEGLMKLSKISKDHKVTLYTPKPLRRFAFSKQRILPEQRLWTQWHFARALRRDRPDVAFVPSHVLPFLTPRSLRSVVTLHDVCFKTFPGAYSLAQRLYLDLTTRFTVRRADKIIVPSQATAKDLSHFYGCPPSKIKVIPHGFRPPTVPTLSEKRVRAILTSFGLRPETPYFFSVGRLEIKKNIARLLQAFSRFHSQNREWRLILGGGRGVGFNEIVRQIPRGEGPSGILMPGYLTPEEKFILFSHARGFVFPSLAEGFGFPILEAAWHRLPILASNLSVFEDFKSLIDVRVDPGEVHSIAHGLEVLSQLPYKSRRPATLTRYNWDRAAQRVWNLLTEST
jgi:glycosyltransferase involved in cell wall biosynthesis